MNILISNDDGYFSAGIQNLSETIQRAGHKIFVVAPDRDYSACGMSITLRAPVTVREISINRFAVSGTPVDCVGLALGGLIDQPIDLVVSGINNGANLSDDVFYSGTASAAMEARRLAYPSIAVSIPDTQPQHYDTASAVVVDLIDKIQSMPNLEELALLNVNVPDISLKELKGCKATVLGKRNSPQPHREDISEKGVRQCWLGGVGSFIEQELNNSFLLDYVCVKQGYASVSPIKAEWLNQPFVDSCQDWLDS